MMGGMPRILPVQWVPRRSGAGAVGRTAIACLAERSRDEVGCGARKLLGSMGTVAD